MIFSAISGFAQKYRILIVIFWLAAAAAIFLSAPNFADVAVTDDSQFLPQNTESSEAAKLLKEKFATSDSVAESGCIVVIYNANGWTEQDNQDAQAIRNWLVSSAAPSEIEGVVSVFDNDLLRQKLISTDQTTMMMQISFSTAELDDRTQTAVNQIREYISNNHLETQAYVTGETALTQDLFQSIQNTIGRTTIVTIILVLIILLIIYRSPIAALLPLIAIGCSFLISMGILSYLGQAGVKFFTLTEAYLVVIIFGIGTDYCLFIASRFREELKNNEPKSGLNYTMRHIGPVIAASALTVIIAFLCLGLSRFGMNKTSGYALALGIGVTLLVGLTLIPALMSLFGKYLFWPNWKFRAHAEGRFSWAKIGNWIVRYPLVIALPIMAVLVIPYVAFSDFTQTDDIISQMPSSTESVQGYELLKEHFPAGELEPAYLLVESSQGKITGRESLKEIKEIAQSLQNSSLVSRVDYFSAPGSAISGMAAQFRILGQQVGQGAGLPDLGALQTTGKSLQELALQYPGIVQSPNFQKIITGLTEVSTQVSSISALDKGSLAALLPQLQNNLNNLADHLESLAGEFNLEGNTPFTTSLLQTYFSTDETLARINIVPASSALEMKTVDMITDLRKIAIADVKASALQGSTSYIGGDSATRADIMITNDADFGIVVGTAIAGILVVIIILLRSVIAPLYMVATVLLNYGATLGITTWLFTDVLKQGGMIYMLPIFIFIILVALGADYNIFLVSRIREEARERPLKEAISHAVANTGGVITSCGIILAGTFAALTLTPLQMVMQLGGAIVIGVLIDTFIVRAILVPAIATLIGRWSWWPSTLFQKEKNEAAKMPVIPGNISSE
jgi:putative drug exporter of the RND superfamily